ncbi:uncharacterized protein EV422DRAFT_538959 [Fimicolochytrium jonesii]|uniref:uncharacterized protein n=1 Tax=Fimicolochytrium jonesii TaxID=1396493 RepID=UPI0022FF2A1F|nr:uncharacterized protein EV422DRAFT_538959 [Fimicolochytrium jonesii]KAI8818174.1 hypothetical protein EV422DRAFT_538959 [Fimicolochytrium jonesii]
MSAQTPVPPTFDSIGITPLQCSAIVKTFLPVQLAKTATAGIAVPLIMIGLTQILFIAIPTLWDHRKQYRKFVWSACTVSCLFAIASMVYNLQIGVMFFTDFRQSFAIDLTQLYGLAFVRNPAVASFIWVCLFVIAQCAFEVVAAVRARIMLPRQNKMALAFCVVTGLACLFHVVAEILPSALWLAGVRISPRVDNIFNVMLMVDAVVAFSVESEWTVWFPRKKEELFDQRSFSCSGRRRPLHLVPPSQDGFQPIHRRTHVPVQHCSSLHRKHPLGNPDSRPDQQANVLDVPNLHRRAQHVARMATHHLCAILVRAHQGYGDGLLLPHPERHPRQGSVVALATDQEHRRADDAIRHRVGPDARDGQRDGHSLGDGRTPGIGLASVRVLL